MTRRGYAISLVAAVAVLVLSIAGAVAVAHHEERDTYSHMHPWKEQEFGEGGSPNMMGRGAARDRTDLLSANAAKAKAQTWVDANAAGAVLGGPALVPHGYRFTATRDGQVVAVVLVDARTGQVSGRTVMPGSPAPSAPAAGGA